MCLLSMDSLQIIELPCLIVITLCIYQGIISCKYHVATSNIRPDEDQMGVGKEKYLIGRMEQVRVVT